MSKIIIDTTGVISFEIDELIELLDQQCWDYKIILDKE